MVVSSDTTYRRFLGYVLLVFLPTLLVVFSLSFEREHPMQRLIFFFGLWYLGLSGIPFLSAIHEFFIAGKNSFPRTAPKAKQIGRLGTWGRSRPLCLFISMCTAGEIIVARYVDAYGQRFSSTDIVLIVSITLTTSIGFVATCFWIGMWVSKSRREL